MVQVDPGTVEEAMKLVKRTKSGLGNVLTGVMIQVVEDMVRKATETLELADYS